MQLSPAHTQMIMNTEMVTRRALQLIKDGGEPVDLDVIEWIMTGELTGELLREARGWVADCMWADLEPEDIAAMPAARVTRGIARHYDGGLAEFVRNTAGI